MKIFMRVFAISAMLAGIVMENVSILLVAHVWYVGSILYDKIEEIKK